MSLYIGTLKKIREQTCNSAHEQAPLSNDTIDSVLRHREVSRAKGLSALPPTELHKGNFIVQSSATVTSVYD